MKILLLGKDGQVGWELQRSLAPLGELIALGRQQADLENLDALGNCIREHQPDVIVNAAAYTAVDKAETEQEKATLINAKAVAVLAEEASKLNAWLVHYSTDYVFNGEKPTAYQETDATDPLSVYGKTKLQGEQLIAEIHAKHLIFRTSWVHAARGNNFAKTMLRLAADKESLNVVADQYGAPTSAELIADVTALILHQVAQAPQAVSNAKMAGIYHLVAGGETTWHGYAQYVIGLALEKGINLKVSPEKVYPIATKAYPLPAQRPKNSRLNTAKLTKTFHLTLPDWRYHVQRMLDEIYDR